MKVTRRARIYQNLTLKSDVAQRKCICPILLSHNTIHAYQTTSTWIPGFWVAAEPFIRVCNELVADWVYLRSPWPITKSVRGSSANKVMKLEEPSLTWVSDPARLRGTTWPITSRRPRTTLHYAIETFLIDHYLNLIFDTERESRIILKREERGEEEQNVKCKQQT